MDSSLSKITSREIVARVRNTVQIHVENFICNIGIIVVVNAYIDTVVVKGIEVTKNNSVSLTNGNW